MNSFFDVAFIHFFPSLLLPLFNIHETRVFSFRRTAHKDTKWNSKSSSKIDMRDTYSHQRSGHKQNGWEMARILCLIYWLYQMAGEYVLSFLYFVFASILIWRPKQRHAVSHARISYDDPCSSSSCFVESNVPSWYVRALTCALIHQSLDYCEPQSF